MMIRRAVVGVLAWVLGVVAPVSAQGKGAQPPVTPPDRDYLVYVGSEGNDQLSLVRFGRSGARVERVTRVGRNPTEMAGPHGVGLSPDGRYVYVSTAHGTPFGSLWKFTAVGDTLLGTVPLGNFPATLQVSPNGAYIYVVNFNLYGDMVPSSVSVVYGDQMQEITRITTCTMPHGSRLNADGSKHYSACMMDDMIVEIDTKKLAVSRHFMLNKGAEHGMNGAPALHRSEAATTAGSGTSAHDMSGHGMEPPKPGNVSCSPTWAQPSPDGRRLYVACNKASDVVEIDVGKWEMTRRIPMGDGVYNLAVTHDGKRLIGTNKRGQSVSVVDLASGKELARIPTKRKVVHGVVVSPDDRYAFVSVEGIGSEPGTVEVIDLNSLISVAQVDVGQQAGGIDFWKTEVGEGKKE